MAEGLLRMLAGDTYESLSAGTHPAGFVHELAIEAMKEIGVDISHQRSKHVFDLLAGADPPPHLLISLCSYADRECPTFPGQIARLHWPCDDPILARGDRADRLSQFRRVRDDMRARIEKGIARGELEAAVRGGGGEVR